MLKQPRRLNKICKFKVPQGKIMDSPHNLTMLACIYTRRSTRIFWYNFEALRLHLTWTIAKKRKLSKKMFFKQKKKNRNLLLKFFTIKINLNIIISKFDLMAFLIYPILINHVVVVWAKVRALLNYITLSHIVTTL